MHLHPSGGCLPHSASSIWASGLLPVAFNSPVDPLVDLHGLTWSGWMRTYLELNGVLLNQTSLSLEPVCFWKYISSVVEGEVCTILCVKFNYSVEGNRLLVLHWSCYMVTSTLFPLTHIVIHGSAQWLSGSEFKAESCPKAPLTWETCSLVTESFIWPICFLSV